MPKRKGKQKEATRFILEDWKDRQHYRQTKAQSLRPPTTTANLISRVILGAMLATGFATCARIVAEMLVDFARLKFLPTHVAVMGSTRTCHVVAPASFFDRGRTLGARFRDSFDFFAGFSVRDFKNLTFLACMTPMSSNTHACRAEKTETLWTVHDSRTSGYRAPVVTPRIWALKKTPFQIYFHLLTNEESHILMANDVLNHSRVNRTFIPIRTLVHAHIALSGMRENTFFPVLFDACATL